MFIINNTEDLDYFLSILTEYNNFIIITKTQNDNISYYIDDVCIIYFYNISNNNEYLLNLRHPDSNNIDISAIYKISDIINKSQNKFYTDSKLKTSFILKTKNLIDINVLYYYKTGNDNKDTEPKLKIYDFFYNKNINYNINLAIPLYKHIQFFRLYKDNIIDIINKYSNVIYENGFIKLNNDTLSAVGSIEKNGVYIDKDADVPFNLKPIYNNIIYPEYNIFTNTGRFYQHKYNLLNLNKNNGIRSIIKSRYNKKGLLLYFDYNSRHMYLIADLIKEILDENPYKKFGKILFNKTDINDEEYSKTKEVLFKLMYSNKSNMLNNIDFFKKMNKFIDELYLVFNINNYVETELFNRKIYKNVIGNINKNKLFNYYIQSYETERSINVINNINDLIENKNYLSKLILFVFDGFLIDYNMDDGKQFITDIKNIITEGEKYPISLYFGENYHNLKKFNIY